MNLQDFDSSPTLAEAKLTRDQIQDLFAAVEQEATQVGANRTAVGRGVDIARDIGKGVAQKIKSATAKRGAPGASPTAAPQSTPEGLSEHQVAKLMSLIESAAMAEALGSAQNIISNITNRITADKLMKAWRERGAPDDSDVIAAVLDTAGVPEPIVQRVYAAMNLPAPGQGAANAPAPQAGPDLSPAQQQAINTALAKLSDSAIQNWINKQRAQGVPAESPVVKAATEFLQTRAGGAPAAAAPQPTQPAAQTAPQPAPQPAAQPAATKPAAAPAAPVTQPAARAPAPPAASNLAPGVNVVSNEPIVIKYKNSDYGLNDQGEWALIKRPDRALPQSLSAFLDQQFELHLAGATETPVRPAAAMTRPQRGARSQSPQPRKQSWLQRMGIT